MELCDRYAPLFARPEWMILCNPATLLDTAPSARLRFRAASKLNQTAVSKWLLPKIKPTAILIFCSFSGGLPSARQLLLTSPDLRRQPEAIGLEGGQKVFPDSIEFSLHVAGIGCYGHNDVLIGHHDYELAACSVRTEGVVPASPELEAVSFDPVRADFGMSFVLVRDLFGGGLLDPFAGNKLLAIPLPLLQIELAQLGDGFSTKVETLPPKEFPSGLLSQRGS